MRHPDIGQMVIAVLTFQRLDEIGELLPLLAAHVGDAPYDVRILVVDNDPAGGAQVTVESAGFTSVRYVHEPTPGISAGRNRAIEEAGDAHLLIFIDDDERPTDPWLTSLVEMYRSTGAAAVTGPVLPDYLAEPDPWIVDGGFFVRKQYASGADVPAASTGNVLFDLDQVAKADNLRFDDRFGLSGGSDTVFTRRLIASGGRIVWCQEAAVIDRVPPQRLTRAWVTRRAFRSGNSWSRVAVDMQTSTAARVGTRLQMTAKGLLRLAGGTARAVLGRLTGLQVHHAKGIRTAQRGRGMIAGAWGRVYHEYRRGTAA